MILILKMQKSPGRKDQVRRKSWGCNRKTLHLPHFLEINTYFARISKF